MSNASRKQSSLKKRKDSRSIDNKRIESDQRVGVFVKIKYIKLSKKQPRRYFDPAKMHQLVASIKQYGILEPLIIRPLTADTYELVAGERRYRAAKEVGLVEVPAIIRELNERQAFELALLENLQRDDLNPIDETEGLLELLCQSLDCSREDVISLLNLAANAKRRDQPLTDDVTRQLEIVDQVFLAVGRLNRESFRTNRLPLLNLPNDVLTVLRQGELEYTKAKAIAKLEDEGQRQEFMQQAIDERLSLSDLKKRISEIQEKSERGHEVLYEEDQTQNSLMDAPGDLLVAFKTVMNFKSSAWNDKRKQREIKALLGDIRNLLSS